MNRKKKIADHVPFRALALPADRRPLVISGPSGVGKGTLIRRLFESHPDTFTLSVSHTTRAPRPGEAHGVDYFYIEMAEFEDLIAADGFVEHARFGSNRYGTSKATIEEQTAKGKVVVLDIEMEVGILFWRPGFVIITPSPARAPAVLGHSQIEIFEEGKKEGSIMGSLHLARRLAGLRVLPSFSYKVERDKRADE